MGTETTPVVVGALGVIKKRLEKYVDKISGTVSIDKPTLYLINLLKNLMSTLFTASMISGPNLFLMIRCRRSLIDHLHQISNLHVLFLHQIRKCEKYYQR